MILRSALALALVVPTAGASAAPCPGRTVHGAWTRYRLPVTSPQAQAVTDAALYVTGGRGVHRSLDGGCTWREVRRTTADVVDLAAAGADVHLLVLAPVAGGHAVPSVVSSRDRGATWQETTAGLPPVVTGAGRLLVAPSDPTVLYLTLDPGAVYLPGHLLRSTDGGRSWEPRNGAGDPDGRLQSGATAYSEIAAPAVDPLDPARVWASLSISSPVAGSVDGGLTWRTTTGPRRYYTTAIDVHHAPGRPARVFAQHERYGPADRVFSRSDDGGETWTVVDAAPAGLAQAMTVESIAHGAGADEIVLVSPPTGAVLGWSRRLRRFLTLDPQRLLATAQPHDAEVNRRGLHLVGFRFLYVLAGRLDRS